MQQCAICHLSCLLTAGSLFSFFAEFPCDRLIPQLRLARLCLLDFACVTLPFHPPNPCILPSPPCKQTHTTQLFKIIYFSRHLANPNVVSFSLCRQPQNRSEISGREREREREGGGEETSPTWQSRCKPITYFEPASTTHLIASCCCYRGLSSPSAPKSSQSRAPNCLDHDADAAMAKKTVEGQGFQLNGANTDWFNVFVSYASGTVQSFAKLSKAGDELMMHLFLSILVCSSHSSAHVRLSPFKSLRQIRAFIS
jgi:hypothetical protein